MLTECDRHREERDALRRSITPAFMYKDNDFIAQQQQKAMEVCDTCGAFLIVGDAQQRIDDHLMGKQHIGYARLRAAVDNLLESRKNAREEREKEMEERRRARAEKDAAEDSSREEEEKKFTHIYVYSHFPSQLAYGYAFFNAFIFRILNH
jgi:predicted ATP-dependent protease